jgi:glycosyltransferase involved in cell wall biosynthesis
MIKELVSIIMPCYNGVQFIEETIKSVLIQTYQNWEMIIIDDSSTDTSVSIIKTYLLKDSRLRLLQQGNTGSASARNNGICHCKRKIYCLA